MYAELIGNYKKYGIKSPYDNIIDICEPGKTLTVKLPVLIGNNRTGVDFCYCSGY